MGERRISDSFAVVASMDDWPGALSRMASGFGWPLTTQAADAIHERRAEHEEPLESLPPHAREMLLRSNALDVQLYERLCDRHELQCTRHPLAAPARSNVESPDGAPQQLPNVSASAAPLVGQQQLTLTKLPGTLVGQMSAAPLACTDLCCGRCHVMSRLLCNSYRALELINETCW